MNLDIFGNLFNEKELKLKIKLVQKAFPHLKNKEELLIQIYPFLIDSSKTSYDFYIANKVCFYLTNFYKNNPTNLVNLFNNNDQFLNIAFETLDKRSFNKLHFQKVPVEDELRIKFIEEYSIILYPILVEGVFDIFLHILNECIKVKDSTYSVTELPAVFNLVEAVLKNTKNKPGFEFIQEFACLFNNTIRNGIAHRHVNYKMSDMIFTDKTGKSVKISQLEFIKSTDNLYNYCNGCYLGILLFLSEYLESLRIDGFNLPSKLCYNEIFATTDIKSWSIENMLESTNVLNEKQLTIYIKNNMFLNNTVQYLATTTVMKVERIINGYDKYFVMMRSKYSLFGTAGFIGKKLKESRETNKLDILLDENGFLYFSKFNPPIFIQFLYRIIIFVFINVHNIYLSNRLNKIHTTITSSTPHHKRWNYSCITNSLISINLYNLTNELEVREYILKNVNLITKSAIFESKRNLSIFSLLRIKPVGFIEIKVINRNIRSRTNEKELHICNIVVCKIKKDFTVPKVKFGCTRQEFKGYDIYWKD